MSIARFEKTVLDYHRKAGRHDLPWRKTRDPYRILVSEVMLQQTQVSRVLKKYEEFLILFPDARSLADAPVSEVLKAWKGLGYNRRALALKKAAGAIVRDHASKFPKDPHKLEELPGIGPSTRGAILAFSFGIATPYIETNIRSVFIHFFFNGKKGISDKDILPLVEKTLDRKDPRMWYYALMDYGVYLKRTIPNPSRASKHHTRQKPFKGSNREVRSRILSSILETPRTEAEIFEMVGKTEYDVRKNIEDLVREGFIKRRKGKLAATS